MIYSAGQAAKAVGVSTATITRAIKRGRISASKDEAGSWRIDPAELHRVFPPLAAQDGAEDLVQGDATPIQDGGLRLELALLEERLRAAEALKAMSDDLRAAAELDRDAWRAQAERLTKALPAPAMEAPRSGRRRWWQPWR